MPVAKKKCTGCGKLIPSGALDCVFCRARQPSESQQELLMEGETHATDETSVGMPMGALADAQAAGADPTAGTNGSGPGSYPSQTRNTAMMSAVSLAEPTAEAQRTDEAKAPSGAPDALPIAARPPLALSDRPFDSLGRTVMGTGGAVLIVLFFMPWHGVSSWRLLDTLAGADFVRQLYYLMGGLVLLATAALPVPFGFRAAVGAAVAAMPVFLGASGALDGWRGAMAALAVLGLPAVHLVRAPARSERVARAVVAIAIAAVAILYFAPSAKALPIAQVFRLIGSGQAIGVLMGLFVLVPLGFAALSLAGLLGREVDAGVLFAVLCLLWAPVVLALRGFMVEDGTQLYVALALLWASATSAVSLAQLLSLHAQGKSVVS